jgi:nondiscriminating aspartyl-tRNA synthetase
MRTLTCELQKKTGETIILQGWLHRIRNLGKIAFVILRDRSGLVQCVVNTKEINIKGIKLESVVEITGEVCKNESVEKGIEVLVKEFSIISEVKYDLPIEINKDSIEANLDAVLNNRVLSIRNPKVNAVFKIQAALAQGFSGYLKSQSFTEIFTPKIVAEGTEGGTELFEVKYFDRKAYLAQSPQFYKQMMVGAGYERVFETGHVYRAESHDTQRHVNEFVSLDLEMGFIQDERDIMRLETEMLINIFEYIKEECSEELKILNVNIPEINGEIPSMRLPDAIQLLREKYNKRDLEKDIDPEGEKLICKYAKEELGSEFIFLTHYPQSKRPMYTMPAE